MANAFRSSIDASGPVREPARSAREQVSARDEARQRFAVAMREMRAQSAANGAAKITADEVDAEIKQARVDRTQRR